MIDFHTHILPNIDDGSQSLQESIEMLRCLRKQGIDLAVATPHFYPQQTNPERFLEARQHACEALAPHWNDEEMPKLLVGAEVAFFEGIGHSDAMHQLCINGGNTLLVEMPFTPWTERMLAEVEELQFTQGMHVVLAHIERYLRMQSPAIRNRLFSGRLTLQMNVEPLFKWHTRRQALQLLAEGYVKVLGSDCHGIRFRAPRMDEAQQILKKYLGEEILLQTEAASRSLLPL